MSLNMNTNLLVNNQNISQKSVQKHNNKQIYSEKKELKSDTFKKKDSNITSKKIGLITVGALAVAILGDFIFAKGKHIKKLFSKSENKPPKPPKDKPPKMPEKEPSKKEGKPVNNENTQVETPNYQEHYLDKINECEDIGFKSFKNFDEARCDYLKEISSKANEHQCKNIHELVNSLIPHNYNGDNSVIGIKTRGYSFGFPAGDLCFDIKNNRMFRSDLIRDSATVTHNNGAIGSYSIQILQDGKRYVSINVPCGRTDDVHRCMPYIIDIISHGTEFTPLQKDLIEIISQRKNVVQNKANADILSVGFIDYSHKAGGINQDIVLSAIKTAKEILKPDEIDREFVDKALNLAKCEKLERLTIL